MITAHLPAGYITGRCLATAGPIVTVAVIGGILPDLDLIWFYLVDHRTLHHHHYWVHVPAFWGLIALLFVAVQKWLPSLWKSCGWAFFLAIFVHLILDTVAGDIKWLWPRSDQFFHLVAVPARFDNWILNFVLHPVFLLEIAIWAVAISLWLRRPAGKNKS